MPLTGVLGEVAESVEHLFCGREILGSNPARVKPMTYKINACRFLARCSLRVGDKVAITQFHR